jgi:hypothetical protein
MAEHKKEVTLTDLQQTILSNDLYNDTDNAGSFTDSIPSNQADFVALVTARSDYKNRKARDDASEA